MPAIAGFTSFPSPAGDDFTEDSGLLELLRKGYEIAHSSLQSYGLVSLPFDTHPPRIE